MQTVNIHEAKTHLSRFVDQAAAGEEIIIARAGKPVARLVALAADTQQPRKLGLAKGRFTIPENFDRLHEVAIREMFGIAD
jgi:prevent-host-death family protein